MGIGCSQSAKPTPRAQKTQPAMAEVPLATVNSPEAPVQTSSKSVDQAPDELTVDGRARSFNAWMVRGRTALEDDNLTGALEALTKAIEINQTTGDAFNLRGLAHLRQDHLGLALADFSKAIELAPGTAKFYANRALVHGDEQDFAEALADLTRAIEFDPDCADWYRERGKIHLLMDHADLASLDDKAAMIRESLIMGEALPNPPNAKTPEQTEGLLKHWLFDTNGVPSDIAVWQSVTSEIRNGRLILSGNNEWLSMTLTKRTTFPVALQFKSPIRDGLFIVFPATTPDGSEFPALKPQESNRYRQLVCRFGEDKNRSIKIALAGFAGLPEKTLVTIPYKVSDDKDHEVELSLSDEQIRVRIDNQDVTTTPLPPGPPCNEGQFRIGKFVPAKGAMSFDWIKITGEQGSPEKPADAKPNQPQGLTAGNEKRAKADAKVVELDKHREELLSDLRKQEANLQRNLKRITPKSKAANNLAKELHQLAIKIKSTEENAEHERRSAVHIIMGADSPFVEADGKFLTLAEKAKQDALLEIHGSPRRVADNYVQSMLDSGSLREAIFVDERNNMITGCIDIRQVDDWPNRIRSVHYRINYVSKAGLVNERLAYVTVFKAKNGLWYVSTDTQIDRNGIHFSER